MKFLQKLKELFDRESDITKLHAEFEENEIDMPMGVRLHYAGGGRERDKIVVKEYSDGFGGPVMLAIEWEATDSKWLLKEIPSKNIFSSVYGRENYDELAEEIATYIRNNY